MKKLFVAILYVTSITITSVAFAQQNTLLPQEIVKPRMRVIIDNDFSGDPDGLFQLVHQILSPSAEIKGIIGSHLKPGDLFDPSNKTAANACTIVREVLAKMSMSNKFAVYEGANTSLVNDTAPQISEGARAIVREAMREDTRLPLYIVCGAGLTDIASAWLMEPKIAKRLTLIWIGGPEYAGIALPPPGYTNLEYNLGIDIKAVQAIFNNADVAIWQIPRSSYRQALLSYAELLLKIKPHGLIGAYLANKLKTIMTKTQKFNLQLGETYILGDSPLVLLTALQSSFEADPSSSKYVLKQAPEINNEGLYEVNASARNIRVYTCLDTRLMFEDFFAKLAIFRPGKM